MCSLLNLIHYLYSQGSHGITISNYIPCLQVIRKDNIALISFPIPKYSGSQPEIHSLSLGSMGSIMVYGKVPQKLIRGS